MLYFAWFLKLYAYIFILNINYVENNTVEILYNVKQSNHCGLFLTIIPIYSYFKFFVESSYAFHSFLHVLLLWWNLPLDTFMAIEYPKPNIYPTFL